MNSRSLILFDPKKNIKKITGICINFKSVVEFEVNLMPIMDQVADEYHRSILYTILYTLVFPLCSKCKLLYIFMIFLKYYGLKLPIVFFFFEKRNYLLLNESVKCIPQQRV